MSAARARHRHLGARHLSLAGIAAELYDRLVDEAVAMRPPGRELSAVGVEGEGPADRDPFAALDEGAAFAPVAEAERLEPTEAVEAEAVVNAPVEAEAAPIAAPSIVPPSISTLVISTSPEPLGVTAMLPLDPSVMVIEPVVPFPVFRIRS